MILFYRVHKLALVVKPTRTLITDYDTPIFSSGVSGPSWERNTYFREEGPFQPLYPICVHIGHLIIFGVLFDY
jgi:hypothetical protein